MAFIIVGDIDSERLGPLGDLSGIDPAELLDRFHLDGGALQRHGVIEGQLLPEEAPNHECDATRHQQHRQEDDA